MAEAYRNDTGIQPATREALSVLAAGLSGDIAINVLLDDVAPAPTAAAWSYDVPFELVDSLGRRHEWFNGDVTAVASDDSTAGTASVSDATPTMVDGFGTVTLSGDAAAWIATEAATLTLDLTINGQDLTDAVFTVTFTA